MMSLPPLSSWPFSDQEFPPPQPEKKFPHGFAVIWRFGLWLLIATTLGTSIWHGFQSGIKAGLFGGLEVLMAASVSLVAGLLLGFVFGCFPIRTMNYPTRVELWSACSSIALFVAASFWVFFYGIPPFS